MTRAAIYLRQSSDPGDTKLAITRQREDCVVVCERNGWTWAEYIDNSCSASNGKPRPAYQRMLTDIRAGLVDAVVAWDLDRLHRKPAELETFIDLADERRLALATVGGDTDLSTDGGRLYARVKGAFAKSEVERKSARQKRANLQQRANGTWSSSGYRKFGYTKDGQPLEPEASALRKAASDVLAGVSLRSIAVDWNNRGLTTTRGNKWTNLQLRRTLANPRNAALMSYKGRVVGQGQWEPLIDADTHRGLVALLSDESRRVSGAFERKHMLSGVAVCGLCGNRMYAAFPYSGRKQRRVYVCRPTQHVARAADPLDAYAEQVVLAYLNEPDTRRRLTSMMGNGERVDVSVLHGRRAGLQARLDELAAMFAAGEIDASQLRCGTSDLRKQLAGIDSVLADLAHRSPAADLLTGGGELRTRWQALSADLRAKVIDELLVVAVKPGRKGVKGFDPSLIDIVPKVVAQ